MGSNDLIAREYAGREFGKVVREVMRIADVVNQRFDQFKPWELAKQADKAELHRVCSDAIWAFYVLTIYLAPVLPATARRVASELFGFDRDLKLDDLKRRPSAIRPFKHLITRVEEKQLDALFDIQPASEPTKEDSMSDGTITIDDFNKLELSV